MRTRPRLAGLALALAAGASLTACTTSVTGEATLVSAAQDATPEAGGTTTDPTPAEPTEPTDEPTAPTPAEPTAESVPADTGGEDLPVPGAGVPGDAGLCQAVAGWFGYAGLALISVDETGYVDPAGVVPLLEALRDAPADHQDASAPVLAAAEDVSAATDAAIDDIESGTDVFVAFEGLTQPATDFGTACAAAGVSV
ncbi:hypothetical protein SAMN04488107_0789 [Geodermatophilus saharensis]|uniref:Uncharacterized protein n=1 Tax=Geodermatophilus saharensis TaxID=1137994 RepID=A0A239AI85_9ACTN|nr:hypothetical protein [Geodermatophilus saharensis]SNR94728.1 hypothetical protein SAMN04488107_0789 [Geodermatophilus saharensis]